MLAAIIEFSIRRAGLVLLLAAGLVVWALVRLPGMAVDVFPELNAPRVTVMTESAGLSADEVEAYVTFPVETAMSGVAGVRRVRSSSAAGLSIVWVDLDWGADLYDARQLVGERLAGVREELPEQAHAEITPITSIAGEVMLLSLSSPEGSVSDLELRAFAEYELRNRLLSVGGVAQVVAIGGELPEYQVHVDPSRLRLYGLAVADVVEAAAASHRVAAAGYLPDVQGRELPLRQQSQVTEASDIAQTVVAFHEGSAVRLGQVAEVGLGAALQRGTATERGERAVVLNVLKSPGVNTLALTARIDALLDQIEPTLPTGMVLNRDVVRQSHFIERSVHNVQEVLVEAAVIIAVVLVLFLMNLRTTLITLTALPVSLAVALLVTDAMGWGINVMTLGGLAVAIGVLVDDAIIDVENVFRRLRENASLPTERRKARGRVVFDASNEIRPAMVFATLIIVMVFLPLLFLQGLEGRFFRPLGLMYVVSILASLLVALTVTPALCALLLRGGSEDTPARRGAAVSRGSGSGGSGGDHAHRDGWLVRWLKRGYEPAVRGALRFRWLVLGLAGVATALSLWLGSTFGTSFLPSFNEGTFTVFLLSPPGTSLTEADRLARGVDRRLSEIAGVRSVVRRTGRAERDEHAEPVSNSEVEVSLGEGADMGAVRREIDAVLGALPGVTTMVGQPLEHRLSHVLSGTPAAIAINVFGEDLDLLRKLAKQIEAALADLPGARDVSANREVMITTLPIVYQREELAAVGLTPAAAAEQVQQAFFGQTVATVNQGVRRYDLVVRLDPSRRESVQDVRDLLLRGQTGQLVRLHEVATIGPQQASNLIAREDAQRKAVVSLNVAEGYNLGDLVAEVRQRVDPIVLDAGARVNYGGQFEAQQSASRTLLIVGGGVGVLMLLLLQVATGTLRAGLLVMVNLPLALIGGIAAVYVTDAAPLWDNTRALLGLGGGRYVAPVVSIASLVGFITLFGIAVRNGILLVNHYQTLMRDEGRPLREAVVEGSSQRLTAILMTAISAALGLVPLALALGEPGSELLAPLAVVVLGGLVSSTVLNLLVVPAGYYLIFRRNPSAAVGRRSTGSAW